MQHNNNIHTHMLMLQQQKHKNGAQLTSFLQQQIQQNTAAQQPVVQPIIQPIQQPLQQTDWRLSIPEQTRNEIVKKIAQTEFEVAQKHPNPQSLEQIIATTKEIENKHFENADSRDMYLNSMVQTLHELKTLRKKDANDPLNSSTITSPALRHGVSRPITMQQPVVQQDPAALRQIPATQQPALTMERRRTVMAHIFPFYAKIDSYIQLFKSLAGTTSSPIDYTALSNVKARIQQELTAMATGTPTLRLEDYQKLYDFLKMCNQMHEKMLADGRGAVVQEEELRPTPTLASRTLSSQNDILDLLFEREFGPFATCIDGSCGFGDATQFYVDEPTAHANRDFDVVDANDSDDASFLFGSEYTSLGAQGGTNPAHTSTRKHHTRPSLYTQIQQALKQFPDISITATPLFQSPDTSHPLHITCTWPMHQKVLCLRVSSLDAFSMHGCSSTRAVQVQAIKGSRCCVQDIVSAISRLGDSCTITDLLRIV